MVIIVEGRADRQAVERALDAYVIVTHGYRFAPAALQEVKSFARKGRSIIIMTDSDHAGENIRKRLLKIAPNALCAYVPKGISSVKTGNKTDIGIEHASPEDIRRAVDLAIKNSENLQVAEAAEAAQEMQAAQEMHEDGRYKEIYTPTALDLMLLGLTGDGGSERRAKICANFGIGHSSAKAFSKKIAAYRISKERLAEEVRKLD